MASVATRSQMPQPSKGKAPERGAPASAPAPFPFDEALNDLMQVVAGKTCPNRHSEMRVGTRPHRSLSALPLLRIAPSPSTFGPGVPVPPHPPRSKLSPRAKFFAVSDLPLPAAVDSARGGARVADTTVDSRE
jgi:hypothetical protein